jgi:hypothetical protein
VPIACGTFNASPQAARACRSRIRDALLASVAPAVHSRSMPKMGLLATLVCVAACTGKPDSVTNGALDPQLLMSVQAITAELGPNTRAAVWLGEAGYEPVLAWNAEEWMPTASAIKVALLIELFTAFAQNLEQPLPGAAAVLADRSHPAVAHFSPGQRTTAQQELGTASVRRMGQVMIGVPGIDTFTYNLAANLVIAHFGGPAAITKRLQERTPAWQDLRIQRYMLSDRAAAGDNEATAHAMSSLHQGLAMRQIPGVPAVAIDAARAALAGPLDGQGRATFAKDGALDSEPVTRVNAGWRDGDDESVLHVVMLAQYGVPSAQREAAGQRLASAARRIEQLLHRAWR